MRKGTDSLERGIPMSIHKERAELREEVYHYLGEVLSINHLGSEEEHMAKYTMVGRGKEGLIVKVEEEGKTRGTRFLILRVIAKMETYDGEADARAYTEKLAEKEESG